MARGALIALAVLGIARLAAADPNDLVLSRLVTRQLDDTGQVQMVTGENLELRALASQLGVVLAPHLLTPADTVGYAGFQLDVDVSQTAIDTKQEYWRVLVRSPDPSGTNRVAHGPGVMHTIGIFAHKGLWLPLPSFELGAGVIHLTDSSMWAAQLSSKLALHEGYHDLPIPSVAVRGALSRLVNQRDLGLTIASLDVTLSKHFGISGAWKLDPFAGYDMLVIFPHSQVIDATPNVDPLPLGNESDMDNDISFLDQSAIYRHRILFGAKVQYDIVELTLEAQVALAGSSVDSNQVGVDPCMPRSTITHCQATDTAAAQTTLSFSAGVSF